MDKKISNKNSTVILLHLFAWVCFLLYPFVLGAPFREDLVLRIVFHSSLLAAFFYFNAFFLIPELLTKRKVGIYFLAVLFLIGGIVAITLFFNQVFEFDIRQFSDNPPPRRHLHTHHSGYERDLKRISRPFFSALFIFAVSTSYKLLSDWFQNERRKKEIENESLLSELSFLKSQVSPHFLFNTLNNIYALSLKNSEYTSDAIMKLSQLLRYMLYESNVKEASLEKEIEYLHTYIDLQKIRLKEDVKLSFRTEGNFSGYLIEAMLLIPFVENAFKHGIDYSKDSFINILISITGNTLFFQTENSVHPLREKDKASGIGLQNVKRRLNLLYPEKHNLVIQETEKTFKVELQIQLL